MLTFGLASSTAKQASSPTTTIVRDAHSLTPCHHSHPWQPPPTMLVNCQQPPPPTTTVAHTPCHQPNKAATIPLTTTIQVTHDNSPPGPKPGNATSPTKPPTPPATAPTTTTTTTTLTAAPLPPNDHKQQRAPTPPPTNDPPPPSPTNHEHLLIH